MKSIHRLDGVNYKLIIESNHLDNKKTKSNIKRGIRNKSISMLLRKLNKKLIPKIGITISTINE